jgi:hypothetical protein
MITPKLEQLIFEGKAFFKTFVAGGSQRINLNIDNDRFIIITDVTYFSSGSFPQDENGKNNTFVNMSTNGMNTQLSIIGERGINRFLFRNNFVSVPINDAGTDFKLLPIGHTTINCYLLHTTQVNFAFSWAQNLLSQTVAPVPAENFAVDVPTDYGRDGGVNIPVTVDAIVQGAGLYVDSFTSRAAIGVDGSNEFSFPIDNVNNIPDNNRVNSWNYPICHVNYVEIIGLPNNIAR